jgi:hypothetical protein
VLRNSRVARVYNLAFAAFVLLYTVAIPILHFFKPGILRLVISLEYRYVPTLYGKYTTQV